MCGEIDLIPADDIVRADIERLSTDFMERYQVACPVLGDDIVYDEPPFSPGGAPAVVRVYVPFTGEHELFSCSGGTAPVITQEVKVEPNQLVIAMTVERHRIGELREMVLAL